MVDSLQLEVFKSLLEDFSNSATGYGSFTRELVKCCGLQCAGQTRVQWSLLTIKSMNELLMHFSSTKAAL